MSHDEGYSSLIFIEGICMVSELHRIHLFLRKSISDEGKTGYVHPNIVATRIQQHKVVFIIKDNFAASI